MMREALHTYFMLNCGWFSGCVYRVVTGTSSLARLLLLYPALLVTRDRGRAAVKRAIAKWRPILSWSVGLERWAKPYFVITQRGERLC
jgi:hypothetical protein